MERKLKQEEEMARNFLRIYLRKNLDRIMEEKKQGEVQNLWEKGKKEKGRRREKQWKELNKEEYKVSKERKKSFWKTD